MSIVTDGGRGVGVEASGTNFPFVAPSDDIKGLLADFYLSHSVRTIVLPLRITWLHGFCNAQSSCTSETSAPSDSPDPIHDADLVVKDSAGTVVFDSTVAAVFRSKSWGDRFRLYEWEADAAVCRALVHTGTENEEDARVFESEIIPENGVLDERTHEILPEQVTILRVSGEAFTDQVDWVRGYNVNFEEVVPTGRSRRSRHRIVMTAQPGGGEGRYPSCEEPTEDIRRINGIGVGPSGDFIMSAAGCYWVERPVTFQDATATVLPAAIRLNNNCGPCCECDDYEKTYQGVRRLYAQFKEIGRRGEVVRGNFRENIARWNAQRECRKNDPTRVTAAASSDGYFGVAVSYCNTDDVCKYELDLKLTFSHSQGKVGVMVPCMTTVNTYSGGVERKELYGSWNEWGNYWAALDKGRSLVMATRLRFTDVEPGDSVTVTATPYIAGVAQPSATTTVALYPCGV